MLSLQKNLAVSVGQFTFPNFWCGQVKNIVESINEFYGEQVNEGFYPHFNDVVLRKTILSAFPVLDAVRQNVQELMNSGYCALFFENINLQSFSKADRNKLLYAISLSLGYPTPTDPRLGKLLWDVKPRPLSVGHFATFSEHSDRAELHTDTQYYPQPEEYFLLYVVRAARCGGGKSLLCSAPQIKECLLKTAEGQEAFKVLSNFQFPFRIPTTFTETGDAKTIETTTAPIFSNKPLIRFRYDTLEKGFQARSDLDVPEARFALKVLLGVLKNKVDVLSFFMPDDALVICNNHTVLHGRTNFEDPERHLIRVRMSSQSLATKSMLSK